MDLDVIEGLNEIRPSIYRVAMKLMSLQRLCHTLVRLCENPSGSVSRSGLRSLLHDLRQVPAAVQEEVVFGGVEAAVRSCFNAVLTPTASTEHVMSWLQNEPHLLLWLPTLYRLCVSQDVSHMVRCHTCKTFPITGLRYRCLKCVNVHVCQSCFLSQRQTRKHKPPHPVLEFCTQPTWRESLSSLVHKARHTLLPRRYTQREADRGVLMWAEPGETKNRAAPPSDASSSLDGSAVHHSSCSSKALQTDETLTTDVTNLQRDKWLLEQEMQAWRLTVQSEHSLLEDRCSEMEVTMETLRQQNVSLQVLLAQASNKMEAEQHASANTDNKGRGDITTDTEINSEEEQVMNEWSEDESQTPSPTIHRGVSPAHEDHCEEGSLSDRHLCRPVEQEEGDTCLSEEGEDYGTCRPEEQLHQTVDSLKTKMETDRWRDRQTGERNGAELVEAAEQVGGSVHHLVVAVRTNRVQQVQRTPLLPATFGGRAK
nr:PREDICTED: dystrotelin-like isoform X2 [Paralichthys olivaceus]